MNKQITISEYASARNLDRVNVFKELKKLGGNVKNVNDTISEAETIKLDKSFFSDEQIKGLLKLNFGIENPGKLFKNLKLREILASTNDATLVSVLTVEAYALPGGWADTIAVELKADKNNKMGKNTLNSTQLRKIFMEVKQIAMRLETKVTTFSEEKGNIWLLMPNLAYAKNRGVIGNEFYKLMAACIKPEKIKSKEDYLAFAQFMEAIVAYFPKEQ